MLAFLPVMLGVGSDMPIQAAYPGRRRILVAATAASAAGFAALTLSPLPFVRDLGLALAAGVVVSAVLAVACVRTPRSTPPDVGEQTGEDASATASGGRRAGLVAGVALAALGWALLPSIPVEARPERLAEGLPALADARRARDRRGPAGGGAVRVQAPPRV